TFVQKEQPLRPRPGQRLDLRRRRQLAQVKRHRRQFRLRRSRRWPRRLWLFVVEPKDAAVGVADEDVVVSGAAQHFRLLLRKLKVLHVTALLLGTPRRYNNPDAPSIRPSSRNPSFALLMSFRWFIYYCAAFGGCAAF